MWPIHTMKYYSAIKRDEVLIHVSTWMNLENSIRSERRQSEKTMYGASLVVQWLGVCLPMQGIRVRALVWEDPACRGAAGPVGHGC